jgi:hypothetical protein
MRIFLFGSVTLATELNAPLVIGPKKNVGLY